MNRCPSILSAIALPRCIAPIFATRGEIRFFGLLENAFARSRQVCARLASKQTSGSIRRKGRR